MQQKNNNRNIGFQENRHFFAEKIIHKTRYKICFTNSQRQTMKKLVPSLFTHKKNRSLFCKNVQLSSKINFFSWTRYWLTCEIFWLLSQKHFWSQWVPGWRLRSVEQCICGVQCDQIGRIFAFWAIVYFGQILTMTQVAQIIGLLYSTVKNIF
jgi:hypothetical protein